jgi:hypothetical protein
MPAFGSNRLTVAFALRVRREPGKGFRLSERIVSALDRFIGQFAGNFATSDYPLLARFLFIYPFVGASDWTHSLNLADFEGNFNRYAITWSGSVSHDPYGVTMGGGSYGDCHLDMADLSFTGSQNAWNWNRRSWGIYCGTNSLVNIRDVSASFVEPKNGYTYWQGMHLRWGDGKAYFDLVSGASAGGTFGNRVAVAVGDSLGLFVDSQRGATIAPYHFLYKRGVYIGSESSAETGMGYGDPGSGAWLYLQGSGRRFSFFFSTKNPLVFESAGQPGSVAQLDAFVEQLKFALERNV